MGTPLKDLSYTNPEGTTLFVYARGANTNAGQACWWCYCFGKCGGTFIEYPIKGQHLRNGNTTSCGCGKAAGISKAKRKHGRRMENGEVVQDRTYTAWINMKRRCNNPYDANNKKNYKDKGITVCDEWENDFNRFQQDMGDCPPKHEIDRIDNNKGYYKENCRWSTKPVSARNRSNVHKFPYKGDMLTAYQLAEAYPIKVHPVTLYWRLKALGDNPTEEQVVEVLNAPDRRQRRSG